MLEYDIDEAEGLLTKNRTNAIKSLEDVKDQLGKWNTRRVILQKSLKFIVIWPHKFITAGSSCNIVKIVRFCNVVTFSLFTGSNDDNGSVDGSRVQLGRQPSQEWK